MWARMRLPLVTDPAKYCIIAMMNRLARMMRTVMSRVPTPSRRASRFILFGPPCTKTQRGREGFAPGSRGVPQPRQRSTPSWGLPLRGLLIEARVHARGPRTIGHAVRLGVVAGGEGVHHPRTFGAADPL